MVPTKYCSFIDVLGYKDLVMHVGIPTDKKIRILNSIYSNIAANISITITEINSKVIDQIFIRSFIGLLDSIQVFQSMRKELLF